MCGRKPTAADVPRGERFSAINQLDRERRVPRVVDFLPAVDGTNDVSASLRSDRFPALFPVVSGHAWIIGAGSAYA
jgi:hypothetical protein